MQLLSNLKIFQKKPSSSFQNETLQLKDIKLLILTHYYPPDYAATGQLIEELAHKLGENGLKKVSIFTGQPGYAFSTETAPNKEEKHPLMIRRSRSSRIVPQRIRGKAINGIIFCIRCGVHLIRNSSKSNLLLITTAPPFLPIVAYLGKLIWKMPYICLMYDLYPDVVVALNVLPKKHLLVRLWNRINYLVWLNAKTIVVISDTMKNRIVSKYPILADKIKVVHNWSNPEIIKPMDKQDNSFAKKYNLTNRFTVLYSGNFGRCHDLDTIMEAAKLLKDKPVQFLFIGNGAKLSSCKEQVKIHQLDNFLFLPFQDKAVLPSSLTSCDLGLVSIAPDLEGIIAPSKLYGILAAGKPVAIICESHSYLKELVTTAGCGETFNHNDAQSLANFIEDLILNPQKASSMGTMGRKYLESNFTPEIIAKQYLEILTLNN